MTVAEHYRLLVTFSSDEATATVTAETYRGLERVACLVFPVLDRSDPLVALALSRCREADLRLFP